MQTRIIWHFIIYSIKRKIGGGFKTEWGGNFKDKGANLIFWPTFLANCTKIKEIGSEDHPGAPLDPPLDATSRKWRLVETYNQKSERLFATTYSGIHAVFRNF